MKDFISTAETEVASVSNLYSVVVICQPVLDSKLLTSDNGFKPEMIFVSFLFFCYDGRQGRNADALAHYFGEDPNRCPFEQGMAWNIIFILLDNT